MLGIRCCDRFGASGTQKCFFTIIVPGKDIVKVEAHASPKAQTKSFERFIRPSPIKLIKKADKLAPYLKTRPDPVIVGYIDKHADPAVAADFISFLNKTELVLRDQYEFVLANSTKFCSKSAKTQDGRKRACPSISVWHPDGDEIVMNASFTIPEFVDDARLIMKLNYTQLEIPELFDRQNDTYGTIIMWGMDKAGQVDRHNRPPKNLTDLQIPRMISRRFRHTHPKGMFYAPAGGFSSMVSVGTSSVSRPLPPPPPAFQSLSLSHAHLPTLPAKHDKLMVGANRSVCAVAFRCTTSSRWTRRLAPPIPTTRGGGSRGGAIRPDDGRCLGTTVRPSI